MNNEEYGIDFTTVLRGIRWVASFVHLRALWGSRQMTLFRPLHTSLLGKAPFAMTILANGRLAQTEQRDSAPYACVASHCLPSAAELLGRRMYVTQWDCRSMWNIFQVVAHSLTAFYSIGQTDCEQIRSRINNNWCKTFRPHRPLSTAYKTVLRLEWLSEYNNNICNNQLALYVQSYIHQFVISLDSVGGGCGGGKDTSYTMLEVSPCHPFAFTLQSRLLAFGHLHKRWSEYLATIHLW